MIADWIDAELHNWAAWCRSGPWPHPLPSDRAMSLEGRYIRDSAIEMEEQNDEKASRPPRPDSRKAEIVQDVYSNRLSDRERRILVDIYVRRPKVDRAKTVRELRISQAMYDTALFMAAKEVGRAFRKESHDSLCA